MVCWLLIHIYVVLRGTISIHVCVHKSKNVSLVLRSSSAHLSILQVIKNWNMALNETPSNQGSFLTQRCGLISVSFPTSTLVLWSLNSNMQRQTVSNLKLDGKKILEWGMFNIRLQTYYLLLNGICYSSPCSCIASQVCSTQHCVQVSFAMDACRSHKGISPGIHTTEFYISLTYQQTLQV